jgi:hypothetical protein
MGPVVAPGTYSVTLSRRVGGVAADLAGPVDFEVTAVGLGTLDAEDRQAVLAFQRSTQKLQRAVEGALAFAGEMELRLDHLRVAAWETPETPQAWVDRVEVMEVRLDELLIALRGDRTIARRREPTPPSIDDRVQRALGQWTSSSPPTATHQRNVEIASQGFAEVLAGLRSLSGDLRTLEAEMETAGAPWTPGRLPEWTPE